MSLQGLRLLRSFLLPGLPVRNQRRRFKSVIIAAAFSKCRCSSTRRRTSSASPPGRYRFSTSPPTARRAGIACAGARRPRTGTGAFRRSAGARRKIREHLAQGAEGADETTTQLEFRIAGHRGLLLTDINNNVRKQAVKALSRFAKMPLSGKETEVVMNQRAIAIDALSPAKSLRHDPGRNQGHPSANRRNLRGHFDCAVLKI